MGVLYDSLLSDGYGCYLLIIEISADLQSCFHDPVPLLSGQVTGGSIFEFHNAHIVKLTVITASNFIHILSTDGSNLFQSIHHPVYSCCSDSSVFFHSPIIDFLTTGAQIAEFEQTVADYVGAKYAVAISNGTAALHVACFAAGIKPGDEVITTPLTFAASANSVLYCGEHQYLLMSTTKPIT